jgi:monoamine oxidase
MPDDPLSRSPPLSDDDLYDTIIIGAGISGLACANRLQQRLPHHRIKVLEARDRIGGRINSVYKNGCRLDTGANWIHGTGTKERGNPLMDILPHKRYRELKGGVMFRPPTSKGETGENENLLIPHEDASKITQSIWGMIGELHEIAHTTPSQKAKETRLVEAVQDSETFRQAFIELPENYHSTLRGLPQFIENMEAAPLVMLSAEEPRGNKGVAPVGLLEFAIDDFDGEQVYLQDGYFPIVEELAKPLRDAGCIVLEAEVDKIIYSDSLVTIRTSKVEFKTKRVVVSLPLGVLKAHLSSKSLFEPELPKRKHQAINHLGYGTLDKIFLIYSDAWWEEEPYAAFFTTGKRLAANPWSDASPTEKDGPIDSFMGFTTQLPGLSISPSEPIETGPRMLSYMNLKALTGQPVLAVFTSCANSVHIENMADSEAQELAHRTFCSWLPSHLPNPPAPSAVHVTRWASDEYSRGSYSHMLADVSEKWHREEFAVPLDSSGADVNDSNDVGHAQGEPVVRFAGEHTSAEHFATAHGALMSGWREADAIIAELT